MRPFISATCGMIMALAFYWFIVGYTVGDFEWQVNALSWSVAHGIWLLPPGACRFFLAALAVLIAVISFVCVLAIALDNMAEEAKAAKQ